MMRLVVIAAGCRMVRDCTYSELEAIGRELAKRRELFRHIPLRITVEDGAVTHLICNTPGD